jgi:hypothetical protein
MAIIINAALSKKIPLPNHEFSSQQASITITGEVTDMSRINDEAARLFRLAEVAVDAQLRLAQVGAAPAITHSPAHYQQPSEASAPSQPYPRSNRRAPPLITPAQRRLLDQLLQLSGANIATVLAQYRVANLDQLTCRDASALIDSLKSQSASRS